MNNTRGVFVLAAVLASLAGCDQKAARIHLETEYQAVYLDNGQVLYGRLEGAGSAYPTLRDVYYIQRQADPESKEVKNVLLRRGSEWHAPNLMYLNDRHIVALEPVGKDSQVAKMIAQMPVK